MKKIRWRLRVLISILIITYITLCNNIVYANEYEEEKLSVLFISSYNSNFISFTDQVDGIKAGFENNVNLRVEYMDLNGYYNRENEEKFYNLLKSSFENYVSYDSIIVGDDEALEFCLRYRNDIFKDIPISFLGIQKNEILEEAFKYEKVSGVREIESIEENLKLIKEFHPETENIIFLNDIGEVFYENIVNSHSDLNFDTIITSELTIDDKINLASQEIIKIEPENIPKIKAKLIELEELLKVKELNKDKQGIELYYNKLKELIKFDLIDSLLFSELERVESFLGIKQIINPIANTLSATASNFAPFKEVTFQYLASFPSSISVKAAIIDRIITAFIYPKKLNRIKIGVKEILIIVNILGIICLYSVFIMYPSDNYSYIAYYNIN